MSPEVQSTGGLLFRPWHPDLDLHLIRQQLANMGLDWDLPPYPPTEPLAVSKPLQVKVLAGN